MAMFSITIFYTRYELHNISHMTLLQRTSAMFFVLHNIKVVQLFTYPISFQFLGYRVWSFADPIGAIVISLYIIFSWFATGYGEYSEVIVLFLSISQFN